MLLALIFPVLFACLCYATGSSKGYSGGLCAVAGAFGGLIAVIIIFLLPDREADAAAYAARDSAREREMKALKDRIAQLEAAQKKEEPSVEESEAPAEPEATADGTPSPARFPARSGGVVTCPHCGRRQQDSRSSCYSCGTPFQYENE